MPETPLDFARVLAALNAGNVRYLLIGGLAMVSHGSAHVTQDVDIFYARDLQNRQALVQALADYHPRLRGVPEGLPFFWDSRTLKDSVNLTLDTDLGAVDLLGEVAGVDFEAAWERSVVLEIYGLAVHVAALDDLIAMKRAANRQKDQVHLLELEALRRLTQPDD